MAFSYMSETEFLKITAEAVAAKKPQNSLTPFVGFTYKDGTCVPQILLLSDESKIRKPKKMVRFFEVEDYPERMRSPESPSTKRAKLGNSYREVPKLFTESDSSDEAHWGKRARVAYSQRAIDDAAGSSRSNSSSDGATLHSKSKILDARRIKLAFKRRSRSRRVLQTRKGDLKLENAPQKRGINIDDVFDLTKRMRLDDDEEFITTIK